MAEGRGGGAEGAAAGTPAESAVSPRPAVPTASLPLDELRSLVLRAYPDALPELVQGETLEALVASAERAVELKQRLQGGDSGRVAGGGGSSTVG